MNEAFAFLYEGIKAPILPLQWLPIMASLVAWYALHSTRRYHRTCKENLLSQQVRTSELFQQFCHARRLVIVLTILVAHFAGGTYFLLYEISKYKSAESNAAANRRGEATQEEDKP